MVVKFDDDDIRIEFDYFADETDENPQFHIVYSKTEEYGRTVSFKLPFDALTKAQSDFPADMILEVADFLRSKVLGTAGIVSAPPPTDIPNGPPATSIPGIPAPVIVTKGQPAQTTAAATPVVEEATGPGFQSFGPDNNAAPVKEAPIEIELAPDEETEAILAEREQATKRAAESGGTSRIKKAD